MAASDRKRQFEQMASQDGFVAALDQSGGSTPKALRLYGIEDSSYKGEVEMMDRMHEMRSRIITNPKFDGSRVVAAILFEATMDREIGGMPSAKFIWEMKRVVPILKIDQGLAEEKDGVQLMKDMPALDALLDRAVAAGIFGTKERSVIKYFNQQGIKAVVQQQFDIARRVLAKGLVPILEPEVDIHASDKEACERLLLDSLLEGLRRLGLDDRVIFKLTLPTQPNLYLPLMGHPCTLRVVALSGGYARKEACKMLAYNTGMIASFSRAFTEGMLVTQSEEDFTKTVDESCEAIFKASRALGRKEMQLVKVQQQTGFFLALDMSGCSTPEALRRYGVGHLSYSGQVEMMYKMHEMRSRIIKNQKFDGSRVVAAILFEGTIDSQIGGLPSATYLWEHKRVVPFLKIDTGLAEEGDGVQLMKEIPALDDVLDRGMAAGIFGTKGRSRIRHLDQQGIKAVVQQQFDIARRVLAKGLVPILEPEVDIHASDKEACERLLLDMLLEGLRQLPPQEMVMFRLTLPTQPNLYLPLIGHPCTLRVLALSGGYGREEACKLLAQNTGMIACFSRAFLEGMLVTQSEEDFTKTLDESCEAIFQASRSPGRKEMQLAKVRQQEGFFAALDQSGGSTRQALRRYGVDDKAYTGEAEMMDRMHEMRSRIITNPKFDGSRVVAAILFEATMDREIGGVPSAQFLWEEKRVVPFLKIDKGLAEEKDGVQLMKDMPALDDLLDRGVAAGIFGTKERSVIKHFNQEGIKAIVQQQFDIARRVLAKGLVPVLEPEVDIQASDKEACERLLLDLLLEGLRQLAHEDWVVFKLTLPTQPDLYLPLMQHPCTLRVLALSGGYAREEACKLLAQNTGMIASFSRAFTEGLRDEQSEEDFSKTLDASCEVIFQASRGHAAPASSGLHGGA